jgi:hypothetical protein
MAIKQSKQIVAGLPLPSANGASNDIVCVGDYTFTGTEAANDIVEIAGIPAGYVPVDVTLDHEDMGGTVTADVGIMSGTYGDAVSARTCGAEFIAAGDLSTAAALKRASVAGATRIAPTTADRSIGVKLSAATTPTAGAKMRLNLFLRPVSEGV